MLNDEAGLRWSSAEVDGYLNDGLRDLLGRTGALQSFATLAQETTAGLTPPEAFYRVPSNLVRASRLQVNGNDLAPLTLADLAVISNWDGLTGCPTNFLVGPWGMKTIRLYPAPQAVVAPVLYYERAPRPITETDNGELLDAYADALPFYAAARCLLRSGENQDLALSRIHMDGYERKASELSGAAMFGFTTQPPEVPYRHL